MTNESQRNFLDFRIERAVSALDEWQAGLETDKIFEKHSLLPAKNYTIK